MKLFRSIAAAFLGLALFGAQDSRASLGDKAMASHVRSLVLELSVDEAEAKLALADPQDAMVAVERARLELYKGDCTSALSTLAKHDLLEDESGRQIGGAARGCISATAGSVVYTDEASGSWVRLSDAEDAVLLPSIYDVVSRTRALFQRELNVVMPKWVRIELVRDQFSLSKMTGLPLTAARTTGTIGIAKWGRVIMVSPRAADGGYGFLDTMAHELTHLALARASTDQAPLWLQEGVARRLESAWREPSPFDDTPRAVDVAALGLSGGIGPDIDAIGPSIALLPSALEAQITYAKVQSFMTFYSEEAGAPGLSKLLQECKSGGSIENLVERASSRKFSEWKDKWKAHVSQEGREIDLALRPGAPAPKALPKARKHYRLGELLLARGHASASEREFQLAKDLLPREASIRGLLARATGRNGREEAARALVSETKDVATGDSVWWSMRGVLGHEDAVRSERFAIMGAPYDPLVACRELDPPRLPGDPGLAALCAAARKKPHSL